MANYVRTVWGECNYDVENCEGATDDEDVTWGQVFRPTSG
jgi:hypothetical protein